MEEKNFSPSLNQGVVSEIKKDLKEYGLEILERYVGKRSLKIRGEYDNVMDFADKYPEKYAVKIDFEKEDIDPYGALKKEVEATLFIKDCTPLNLKIQR